MMVVRLNQKGGIGETMLARPLAGQRPRQGKRIMLIDADPQGSALDWSEQRVRRRFDHLFGITVDITRALRERITTAVFQRGVTVADMLRDLLAREFLNTDGGQS